MQLNKVLKGLAIALPVLALSACANKDATSGSTGSEVVEQGGAAVTQPIVDNGGMTEQELKEAALRKMQTVYFAFDNAEVSADYATMLEAHATYLRVNKNKKVLIEGHADERGTPEYNIALGERRANAVSRYLQALGVSGSQISIVSYGEEKPLVQGQTQAAYAKNRRAVLVY